MSGDGQPLRAALQLPDRAALESAAEHLAALGHVTRIAAFEEVEPSEHRDWMVPEAGGYLLYLPEEGFDDAMTALGRFFGCTE